MGTEEKKLWENSGVKEENVAEKVEASDNRRDDDKKGQTRRDTISSHFFSSAARPAHLVFFSFYCASLFGYEGTPLCGPERLVGAWGMGLDGGPGLHVAICFREPSFWAFWIVLW